MFISHQRRAAAAEPRDQASRQLITVLVVAGRDHISDRVATLHHKVVVTAVGDIRRARGARAYNGALGGRDPSGVQGQSPWWGSGGEAPLKLKGFGKTTSKSVHKFSTFTTYMRGLVSYFADKKQA